MTQKGFTLVELTVVIGILAIVLLAVSAPFVNVLRYQRNSQQSDNMRDNMQFVLNVLDKELRTSSNPSIASGVLQVVDQEGVSTEYRFAGGVLQKNGVAITDSTIFNLTNVQFYVNESGGSALVPVITIVLTATSIDGADTVTMQGTTMPRNK